MKNRFDLKFTLSQSEFVQAHRGYLRDALFTTKNLFVMTVALLIGLAQAGLFGPNSWIFGIFIFLWCAVVGLVLFVYIVMPGRIYRNHPEYQVEQRVIVGVNGIDWAAGKVHRVILWKEIDRASDVHPDYIYFHPKQGYPHVIPKESFSSIEDLQAFDKFVQSQILSHKE